MFQLSELLVAIQVSLTHLWIHALQQYDAPDEEDKKVAKIAAQEVDRKFGDLDDQDDEKGEIEIYQCTS